MKKSKLLNLFVIAGLSLLCRGSAWAAEHVVAMYYYSPPYYYAYVPSTLTVTQGDTVTWSNADYYTYQHSSTSGGTPGTPSGLWDSGTLNNGQTYTLDTTSISPGTYPYFCSVDYTLGMTGTLIVSGQSFTPPTINLTNPAPNTVFAAPASVTLQATAANGSGTVTNVQFLVGSRVLANVTAAPYSATTNNLAAGSYTLAVIATDNNGLTATNTVNISVVTPAAVAVGSAAFSPPNHFRFSYTANTGLSYVVQVSSNLLNWSPLVTNVAAANTVNYTNLNTQGSDIFYRVGRLPNP